MSVSPLDPIQAAVYAALTGGAALMAMITGVFDYVPQQQAFPYVRLGLATEASADAHDQAGDDVSLTISVFSRYAGFKEAHDIAKEIDLLLDDAQLVVAGWGSVKVAREFRQSLEDPDGVTRHVVSRYRIETFQAA